jgi:hypothetical protein
MDINGYFHGYFMIFSWRFPSHGDTETSSSRHGIPGDPRCTEGDVPDRLIVSQVGPQAPPKAEAMIWSLVQPKKSWEHLSVHLRSIISEYNIYIYIYICIIAYPEDI